MDERQRILVVDDERLNIEVLVGLLKPDYKMMVAKSGERALEAARSASPPDLILLDIMMPEMDGYEVCRRLKEVPATRDIPVIFVSAMSEDADETRGLGLGAVDYITKPISPAIVQARVKTHLALRSNLRALQEANRVIEAQRQRMQSELNVGRDIQLAMLPTDFPRRSDVQLHALLRPAREVGGDFYDFFFIGDDVIGVCVGDVSGKGVPAALFTAVTKTLIRSYACDALSPADVLTHANDQLSRENATSMFVTLFLGSLDLATGRLTYANAGHNPPYLRRHDGGLERLDQRHGPVLGAMDGMTYSEDVIDLHPRDKLLLYTDGVTEAMNDSEALFEEERLRQLLLELSACTDEEAVRRIVGAVDDFAAGAEQADDITVLSLSYSGRSAEGEAQCDRLSIRNESGAVPVALEWFEQWAAASGTPPEIVPRLCIVLDELLSNTINYAYRDDDPHEIEIGLKRHGGKLTITLTDDGVPFNPFLREAPDVLRPLEEREVGGLGIHLVRNLVDSTEYKRKGRMNEVVLVKEEAGS